VEEIEEIVRPCGLGKTKARDIKASSIMLRDRFGGQVPDTQEELLQLPGVGRKSANLILGDVFGKPEIVTDTHCIRITNRLGLSVGKNPYQVEKQLDALIEKQDQAAFCHALVFHGRAVCQARSPKCDMCTLLEWCPEGKKSVPEPASLEKSAE
jgi:endonuclease-3